MQIKENNHHHQQSTSIYGKQSISLTCIHIGNYVSLQNKQHHDKKTINCFHIVNKY